MTQSEDSPNDPVPGTVSGPTFSDYLEEYQRRTLANLRDFLPEAARQLKGAGVARVLIQYDGCGDSGQIESVVYLDHEGKSVDLTDPIVLTEDRLTELFYDLTQVRRGGWENGDGAYGEFTWDLMDETIHHTHNDRFTDYNTTEYDGL